MSSSGEGAPRLIVGLSGASGVVYGVRALEILRELGVETHLVISKPAALTLSYETDRSLDEVKALASAVHPVADVGASIASGSFKTMGMLVAPCSMSSLAGIATGVTENLLTRAADVVLKERRRLVLLARETPLHEGHLENMLRVTRMGAVVAPPVPAFYANPKSLDDMVDHTVARALDLFGLDSDRATRWREGE